MAAAESSSTSTPRRSPRRRTATTASATRSSTRGGRRSMSPAPRSSSARRSLSPAPRAANIDPPLTPIRLIVLLFVTHGFLDSLLLSSLNPIRCVLYNTASCTSDEEWIMNWQAFAHAHVFVLLGVVMTSSGAAAMTRLLYLCALISTIYLSSGIFVMDTLNSSFGAVQAFILVGVIVAVLYIEQTPSSQLIMDMTAARARTTSHDARKKYSVTTIALFLQFLSSCLRVIDKTFGNGKHSSYMGDTTSPLFQNMSNLAVRDMFVVVLVLLFSMIHCTVTQQKSILLGQAAMLFLSLLLLIGPQGELMDPETMKAGAFGTFLFMMACLVGAM